MAHDLIIILDDIDTLMGNAEVGQLYDLRVAVEAAHTYLVGAPQEFPANGEELHDLLHEVQEFLQDGTNMNAGAVDVIGGFVEDINNLLP